MEDEATFDTAAALDELRGIADAYGVPLDIEAVPDVQRRSRELGADDPHPFRSGAAFRNCESGRYVVLLASPLTQSMVGSAIGGMLAKGLTVPERLWDISQFARHLLLHEMAHILDQSRSEAECDKWAFGELEKHLLRNNTLERTGEHRGPRLAAARAAWSAAQLGR